MAALRPLAWLAVALLSLLSATVAAEVGAPAPLGVAAGPEAVLVTLNCPEPAPSLAVAVDHTPVPTFSREILGAAAPAVALVVDRSAPMGAAGTPHSTGLRDAVYLAGMLLAMAPPDAAVALVAVDTQARVALPLTGDREAARAALASLAVVPPAVAPHSAALAEGIELGLGQLRGAPPGPRAIVAFAAETSPLAPLRPSPGSGGRMLIVGHGGELQAGSEDGPGSLAQAAAELGAAYAPYHGADIAALPALNRAIEGHFRRLLLPGERLRLGLPAVGPGAHLLTVEGCGAPLATAFAGPRRPDASALTGAALVALALCAAAASLGHGRRRVASGAATPQATTETRRRAAAAITTARRATGPIGPVGLQAVVWDGRRRRAISLEGRHWTIGCDPGCAIRLEGEGVAPLHARLSAAGDRLTLTDLESMGGTRVGACGRPLTPGAPEPLNEGELVVLGQTTRLMIERAVAGPEEAS